jgi:hypothetical protein
VNLRLIALLLAAVATPLAADENAGAPGYPPVEDRIKGPLGPDPNWREKHATWRIIRAQQAPALEIADHHLENLRPNLALVYYRKCLDVGRALLPHEDMYGSIGARKMARAYTQIGDFKRAAAWLEFSHARVVPISCGTAWMSQERFDDITRRVWGAAADPAAAEGRLRRFVTKVEQIEDPGTPERWEQSARNMAAREASFLLAELLVKRGERKEAETLLRPIAEGVDHGARDPLPALARAYLRQLGA